MRIAHVLVCHSVKPMKLFASIPIQDQALWYVFLHNENLDVELIATEEMRRRNGNLFPYKYNRGLAKSWNEGIHLAMEAGCDAVMLLNDDLYFYDGAYNDFIHTVKIIKNISRNTSYVTMNGLESGGSVYNGMIMKQSFACCALMRPCLEAVGYFDENFKPAYFEDVDYFLRAGTMGFGEHLDERTLVEHERSSTVQGFNETERTALYKDFALNKDYLIRKWGSEEGGFSYPFNDKSFNAHISFAQRQDPYGPKYRRSCALT